MPVLNFFARSGPKIEKIDSLRSGRGIEKNLHPLLSLIVPFGRRAH